jgi:hypothetical protein
MFLSHYCAYLFGYLSTFIEPYLVYVMENKEKIITVTQWSQKNHVASKQNMSLIPTLRKRKKVDEKDGPLKTHPSSAEFDNESYT